MKKPRANRYINPSPYRLTVKESILIILTVILSWACVVVAWAIFG